MDVYPLEKISCLLVTAAGRIDYFKRSYKCYLDQTYPNKELVIVNEGPKEYQEQIKSCIISDDVKFVFLDGEYTLGALRNISIALCNGDIFVQWDDDDYNHPERLISQYKHLVNCKKTRVTYLTDQLHYYFNTHQLYWNNWWKSHSGGWKKYGLIPGTIMAYKKDFPYRYPSAGEHCAAGEDSVLAYNLCETHEDSVKLVEGMGHMHVYTFHGLNVWDIGHHKNISLSRGLPVSFINQNRQKICSTLEYLKFSDRIEIMGREGLAFIYDSGKNS